MYLKSLRIPLFYQVYWGFLLLFSYSCPAFFPLAHPNPTSPTPTVNPHLLAMPSICVPLLTPSNSVPHYPSPLPSVITINFAHLFVLLIRFHL